MTRFIGIDISERRGCAVAAIDGSGRSVGTRCCDSTVSGVIAAVREIAGDTDVVIGVDSPRMPLARPRAWYWNKKTSNWRPRKQEERGWGRHCEVVISSLGLANPQWTPLLEDAPNWMRLGFELYKALGQIGQVHEVFPSAAYSQLNVGPGPSVQLTFAGFANGPKDMLDAYVGAVTVAEVEAGRGSAVGGGDQFGTIVLPRPTGSAPANLLVWPARPAV